MSNSTELQFHLMKIAVEHIEYLSSGHYLNPAGCSDQLLYALQKMTQWAHPDMFRDK